MPRFVIIGGGLSGIYAALLLERRGLDYILLEARERFGGRIESIASNMGTEDIHSVEASTNLFDVGATWYWPAMQPQLTGVIRELELESFEQYEQGDMLIDRSSLRPPVRVSGYLTTPPSMRLVGGMSSMVKAIRHRLPPEHLHIGIRVHSIHGAEDKLTVITTDAEGMTNSIEAEGILLAIPPRLAVSTIEFLPKLPLSLKHEWENVGTWMASHAKYVATYDKAFWRSNGLSGEAQSTVGPLAEIHDASTTAEASLFGFLGIPAEVRLKVTEDELKTHCRAQLVRLFGTQAFEPRTELLKDWSREPLTATTADQRAELHHTHAPIPHVDAGPWRNRLVGIASEWAPQFPGYLAGAIDAATRGVHYLCQR